MRGLIPALCLATIASAQVLPQDRLRTGMVEAGGRAWEVEPRGRATLLVGASVSRFLTDNVSAGLLLAGTDAGALSRSFVVDALLRHYTFPLQSWSPWFELRAGAVVAPSRTDPSQGSGATHLAAGFGLRWRPASWLSIDLQLVGFERWGYSDPSEGTSGTVEWLLQSSPAKVDGWRILPSPSLQFQF